MRRVCAAAFAGVLALILVDGARSTAAGRAGTLSIATVPDNATVFVDGRELGVSPLHVNGIPAGDHRLRIVKNGYRETTQTVTIEAGQPKWLKVMLRAR
jgi:PEGA domain